MITQECGKTLAEAEGELRRGIENVEVATGIPTLMLGSNLEDIASGIDELMIRQPVGIVAAITPFNFPAMIPLWFLPYAVACGNAIIIKPSEKTPMTMGRDLRADRSGRFPPGIVNLVHGGKDGRRRPARSSRRPGDLVRRLDAGRALRLRPRGGQRQARAVPGRRQEPDRHPARRGHGDDDAHRRRLGVRLRGTALPRVVGGHHGGRGVRRVHQPDHRGGLEPNIGYGLDAGVEMGPVISPDSRQRIQGLIAQGVADGAKPIVDGRAATVTGYERGNFLRPTVLADVDPASELARTEVFGPVLSVMRATSIEDAIGMINRSPYGNMSCLFTSSGAAARQFRYEVRTGNVGINVGVAAPMAYFPFSGWKDSFFGDLHAQGRDAIDFYTEKKIVVERWPPTWSRKF